MTEKFVNPYSPYPGREIFVGTTPSGKPCFVYLVTGRSPASRERRAVMQDNGIIRIMPSDKNAPFDPLRHYIAVKLDEVTGLAVVTNGIQTEAIYEGYRLSINLNDLDIAELPELLHSLLSLAGAEPDSYHTPRIAVVVIKGMEMPQAVIGTIGEQHGTTDDICIPEKDFGWLSVVSTYFGNLDNPRPNIECPNLFCCKCPVETPVELANYIFDGSYAEYEGQDIRVCAIAGVFGEGKWGIHIINTR